MKNCQNLSKAAPPRVVLQLLREKCGHGHLEIGKEATGASHQEEQATQMGTLVTDFGHLFAFFNKGFERVKTRVGKKVDNSEVVCFVFGIFCKK